MEDVEDAHARSVFDTLCLFQQIEMPQSAAASTLHGCSPGWRASRELILRSPRFVRHG
jgi:hypothetical protein